MTLQEIKTAVQSGVTVYWGNPGYKVVCKLDKWYIEYTRNSDVIGLTWQDENTLNGREDDFYIA